MEKSTTRISFCTQWSRMGKRMYDAISEEEAARRHRSSELYTAVLSRPASDQPWCFLEFTKFGSVGVEFLDSSLRTYFDYTFQQERPGELFISMSRRLQFPNPVDDPHQSTVLYFNKEGRLTTVRYLANPDGIGSKIVDETEQIVDVTRNWEPFPEFAKYSGLVTLDRGTELLRPPLSGTM